ncbi:MAG TPA: hypothetical protein VJH97_03855 [Candidatus Nanoarchaeia archaeon]|nr:hypothetical protein [Candidatus Nanoarchaeia archaeon]
MKNALKKMVMGAVLLGALYAKPSPAQKNVVNLDAGYNALEALITQNKDIRTRAWVDVGLSVYDVRLGYHGMHEADNLDDNTYFGKHMVTLGKKGAGTSFVGIVKATKDGSIDEKVGLRNTSLVKSMSGYGRIDATANDDAASVLVFYGRPVGKGLTVELTHEATQPYHDRMSHYTELQLNKDITKWLSAVGRIEIYDFKDTKVMAGFAIHK